MDPIAELLSQLSGVRRAANLGQSHATPQLQQLQMQLQLDRHSTTPLRQAFDRAPIERVIRRHQQSSQQLQSNASQSTINGTQQQLPYVVLMEPNPSPATLAAAAAAVTQNNNNSNTGNQNSITNTSANKSPSSSQFLLSRYEL